MLHNNSRCTDTDFKPWAGSKPSRCRGREAREDLHGLRTPRMRLAGSGREGGAEGTWDMVSEEEAPRCQQTAQTQPHPHGEEQLAANPRGRAATNSQSHGDALQVDGPQGEPWGKGRCEL